ncbi:hypothetical protein [Vibrio metoecus]|uniref:hypothetical protein n=1 Tax=Vibrio metoecus TaxID=1481663 RepID=UPI000510D9A7|nr:hypothetical protein [Vibrio metoecus]
MVVIDFSVGFSIELPRDWRVKGVIFPRNLCHFFCENKDSLEFDVLSHPMYHIIVNLLNSVNSKDNHVISGHKIGAIVNILSITNTLDGQIEKFSSYIRKKIVNKEPISLDSLCSDHYMSRRKAQYIFSRNNTTYAKMVKDIKNELMQFSILLGKSH